jgi:hypothetical protein
VVFSPPIHHENCSISYIQKLTDPRREIGEKYGNNRLKLLPCREYLASAPYFSAKTNHVEEGRR